MKIPDPKPQKNKSEPVCYLSTDDEHLMYGVREGVGHNPPCPFCFYGTLTEEIGATGTMWVCTGEHACNQRFWVDDEVG